MGSRVKKWGSSAAVNIPAYMMHAARLDLSENVRDETGGIVIEPVRQEKYDLDKLLKGITSKNQHEIIDFGPVVGKEALSWPIK